MAGYILKYSAGTYQRKISALEGYYSQLVTHLEVKDRMDDCKNTNLQYQQVVDDLTNAGSTVDNIVSDVKDASKAATDAAGAAASIAGLIV